MPRRYRRYTRIVTKPKRKWASNINDFSMNLTFGSSTTPAAAASVNLVVNAAQSATPTPVVLKTGNFKIQGDAYFSATSNQLLQTTMYVVYVPQAVPITSLAECKTLIDSHPEWIMAWKVVDLNGASNQVNAFSVSSRLKRNLNSGDRIVLICIGDSAGGGTGNASLIVHGKVQHWVCAN